MINSSDYVKIHSSDYIKIQKQEYLDKLVALEAVNKALTNKINAYEEILKYKIGDKIPNINKSQNPMPLDTEEFIFRKNVSAYLNEPEKNDYLASKLIIYMLEPNNFRYKSDISAEEIKMFVNFY